MYNTETVIKTFALDILRHLYVYLLYFHKKTWKGTLGGLKASF